MADCCRNVSRQYKSEQQAKQSGKGHTSEIHTPLFPCSSAGIGHVTVGQSDRQHHSVEQIPEAHLKILPAYQVGKIDEPGKTGCLWSQEPQCYICQCARDKSMEAPSAEGVVYECKASNNRVHVTACNAVLNIFAAEWALQLDHSLQKCH